jgi:hypothetical protein
MKRTSSSNEGRETCIWRNFYTQKLHKTYRIKLAASVAQYVEIYFKRMFIRKPDGINRFGRTADVRGLCEYSTCNVLLINIMLYILLC